MLRELILNKLEVEGRKWTPSGKNFIITHCLNPNHHDKKPSFAINLESGFGKCFSCSFSVNKKYWLDDMQNDEDVIDELMRASLYNKIEKLYDTKDVKTAPTLYMPSVSRPVEPGWRGLNKDTIEKYQLYICESGHFQDRVIFPMWDYKGNTVAFNSRALNTPLEGMQKYKYSKGLFVNELIYPPIDKGVNYVVLVEGIMDALLMKQDGINAIFNFGINMTFGNKKISELLKNGIETIYIGLDNDTAGIEGTVKYLTSSLSDYFEIKHARMFKGLVPYYMSGCKDYGEFKEKELNDYNK
jgi:DNA primase